MNPAAKFLPAALLIVVLVLSPLASATHPPPVFDTHGDPIHFGPQYLILPANDGGHHGYVGGGLTLGGTATDGEPADCRLTVFQDGNPSSRGLPITFSPATIADVRGPSGVPTATDVSIQFAASTTCTQSTVWKLGKYDEDAETWFVVTGGAKATPGRRLPLENLFRIVKVQEKGQQHGQVLFKIAFCPPVCKVCHASCRDVGIFVDGATGDRRLALVDHGPFLFQIKKA